MTPTERAKRSDALYYETVSVTRRVLCDMIANREADLDDLRKENGRMRESVKRLMTQRDERLAKAEVENAKLREQLAKARDPQRIGGTADPESFVYAIEQLREFRWQHATNDEEAIPYINNVADAHKRETAKLLELVSVMAYCNQFSRDCDGCSMNGAAGIITGRAGCDELLTRLRELGVEVDG